jgi:TetR/AcrR family transcriptional regulator
MFEGLIAFIEETIFGLVNKITAEQQGGLAQLEAVLSMLLGFARKNRGMTRVLIGDALVNENERLQARINQLHDRLEATLKQCLRFAATQGEVPETVDAAAHANLMLCFVIGRWHQFAKSGFKRDPLEAWPVQWKQLVPA